MQRTHCIYCAAQLAPGTRWAHVWPAALGGRLKSRKICCNGCNNAIGRHEKALFESLRRTLASVGAVDDRGNAISTVIQREGYDYTLADGNATYREPGVSFDDTRRALIIPLPFGLNAQSRKVANALRSHGVSESDLDRFYVEPSQLPANLPLGPSVDHYDISLGRSTEHKQAIVKMALELVAFHRIEQVLRPELTDLRNFVRYGGERPIRLSVDTRSRGSGLISRGELPRVYNSIEVWTVGTTIHFRATFLGPLAFTCSLTTMWNGNSFRAGYAFDAREPGRCIVNVFSDGDGWPLATWQIREEAQHITRDLEVISRELADERAQRPSPPSAPIDEVALRAAVITRLTREKGSPR